MAAPGFHVARQISCGKGVWQGGFHVARVFGKADFMWQGGFHGQGCLA